MKPQRAPDTLGASDIAAICGESSYGSAYSVFMRLTGRVGWDEFSSGSAEWGNDIESALLANYQRRFNYGGKPFEFYGKTYMHPVYAHLGATPDATNETRPLIIDAKNYDSHAHIIQALWQIWVFNAVAEANGREKTDCAIFHICDFGKEPQPKLFEWNEDLFGVILQTVEKFWTDNVLKNMPPEPDAHEINKQMLARYYPLSETAKKDKTRKQIDNPEIDDAIQKLLWYRESIKELEEAKRAFEYRVLQYIGENYGCEGKNGGMIWYNSAGGVKYKEIVQHLAQEYNIPIEKILKLESDPRFRGDSYRVARLMAKK